MGAHPLNPVRLELTIALARLLGVLERPTVRVVAAEPADDELLTLVHQPEYIAAVRAAPDDPFFQGWGLNTADNPVFPDMHQASARVVGAAVAAAEAVWRGEERRAITVAGGLHPATPPRAAGSSVYHDPAIAIARLLAMGASRVAYIDIDAHHGDGVQVAFWADPRVLTISLHQSPVTLFPGTGFPDETGGGDAVGTSVNV